MKYIKQLLSILIFSLAGELLHLLLPMPIPASVYGLILLFLALCTKLVRLDQIESVSQFLIDIMPILFVAPAVNLLDSWTLIAPDLAPICIIVVLSTLVTFFISGALTQWLLRKHPIQLEGGEEDV